MKFILAFISLTFFIISNAQDTLVETSNWKTQATFGLNGTQSSFFNWSAGGRNNISLLSFIESSANYAKNDLKWSNDLGIALGGIQYIGIGSPKEIQKSDDKIDFATNFGLKMKKDWYYSILGSFKTQFLDGFSFPNDSVRVSSFMAPGYVTLALGLDFSPNDNFTLLISPIASKMTFVGVSDLADAGAYGVDAAELDALGNVITAGKKFRGEFGAYIKMRYNKELAKNILMKSKLELFSNYLDNPDNIDINADIIFNFKVNSWFSASLNWTLLYDDDIQITDVKGNVGPRTQFKSILGVGVSYTMKNLKEKK